MKFESMYKKTLCQLFFSLTCFTLMSDSHALPKDPQISSGTAEFHAFDAHTMEIRSSDQAIINYSKFDIGKQEKVRFIQNASSSCVLNRVQGQDPSQIFGSLESNGKVFLVNPNGIYFGPESKVNVGSLIASTLDISDEDFLREKYRFTLGKDSLLKNEGSLESQEGSIVLMGSQIQNLGSIEAKAGTVLLGSGEHITLDFIGDGLIQFSVEGSLKEALIEHLGSIKGSTVSMKLPMAKKAIQEIVNLEGLQEGDVFIEENGVIKFSSASTIQSKTVLLEGSKLSVEGIIDVSSSIDQGGKIRLLGREILLKGSLMDASGAIGGGEVLIGGEYQGKGITPYASKVSMDDSSHIFADAKETGDGGLVVLWSLDQTLFNGEISAQGGRLSGNGGLVETSAKESLGVITGHVNTMALNGETGQWLLDPSTVYVQAYSPYCDPTYGSCDDSALCSIDPNVINNATSHVVIQAQHLIGIWTSINMVNPGINLTFDVCSNQSVFLYVGSTITTNGGNVTFPTQASNGNAGFFINGNLTINTSGGDVNLPSLSSGSSPNPNSITINAGSGVVTINTPGYNNMGSITINSADHVESNYMVIKSGSLTMPGIPFLATGTNTPITVPGTIQVGSIDASISGATVTVNGGTLSFEGPIGDALVVNSQAPFSFLVNSGNVTALQNVTTAGGTLSITPPLTLPNDVTLTSNGGNIVLSNTVNGAHNLSVAAGSGIVFFNGDIGGTTPLTSLQVTSASLVNLPSVTTSGSQIYIPNSPISLNSNVNINGGGGNITFGSSVDASVDGNQSLTFTNGIGNISLGGEIGGNNKLDSFQLVSGNVINWPSLISTTNEISFTPAVVLNKDSTWRSENGPISVLSTIDGQYSLNVSSGIGTVFFDQSVGSTTPLQSLQVLSGTSLQASMIETIGSIYITPPLIISTTGTISSTTGNLTFESYINALNANIESLTVEAPGGTISFGADIGSGAALQSFTVLSGNIAQFADITTVGGLISITPSVSLDKNVTLTSTSGGVTFSGTIDATSTGSLAETLTINSILSPVILSGAIGGSHPLGALTVAYSSGTTVSIGSSIFTDSSSTAGGQIQILSPITLTGSTVMDTTRGGTGASIVLSTVTASSSQSLNCIVGSSSISIGTITGPSVSLTGTTITLQGAVTAVSLSIENLGTLTIDAGVISLTGNFLQAGAGPTSLGENITANLISFAADLTLIDTPITLTATGGDLSFEGIFTTLTDTQTLTLIASGSILIQEDLIINLVTINAGNDVVIEGSVNLGSGAITSTGGDISTQEIFSSVSFTAEADAGLFTCKDLYSGSCTLQTSGSILIDGSLSATDFTIVNCDGALISGLTDVSIMTLTNAAGNIVFQGYITITDALTTTAQGYGIVFENGGLINSATNFLNTGGVTLHNGNSSLVFSGGLTSTGNLTTILGTVGTTTGSMSFADLVFDVGNSSLITEGYSISVSGTTTLTGNATFTTSNGDITFVGRVEGPGYLVLSPGTDADITFESSVGANVPLAYLTSTHLRRAFVKGVRAGGQIHVTPDIKLSDSSTTFSAGTSVILGNIDGTAVGSQSLTIRAGTNITVGVLGGDVALGTVLLEAPKNTSIQNITTQGTITITGDTILSASSILDTTAGGTYPLGFDVTLQTVDGVNTGSQGLTITAGSSGRVLLEDSIGRSVPLASLDLTGFIVFFGGPVVNVTGTQNYYFPTIVGQICVFTTFGDITFHSSLNATSKATFLSFYMGGGAVTFLGEVGDSFMGALAVFNSGSFSSQSIRASSLNVTGGLPTITLNDHITLSGPSGIFLDGGPIYLGGEIDAKHVFFRSSATMVNLDEPQPINISGDTPIALEYFNALGGNIGSPSSPIEINTVHTSNLGANSRADFSGEPFHGFFFSIPSNPPCIVTFNGVTILDCNTVPTSDVVFGSVPKNLLYVPGLYSSWDNLSNDVYFEEMPENLVQNPGDRTLFYTKPVKPLIPNKTKKIKVY